MAKSQKTAKTEKRKAPPTAWKKGQSGNPGGRPKNQHSISYWLKEYGQLTPKQLADRCVQYAVQLLKVKGDLTMFEHVAVRMLMDVINEPTPGLMALLFERTEGKVSDKLEVYDWRAEVQAHGLDPDEYLAMAQNLFAKVNID